MEEKELLIGIKNADERAFKQIFDQYVRKVYHFIFGYVRRKTEAQDLTQLVFQKLWEKRASIDSSALSAASCLPSLTAQQLII